MAINDAKLAELIIHKFEAEEYSAAHLFPEPGSFVCFDNTNDKTAHFRFPHCISEPWLESRIIFGDETAMKSLGFTRYSIAKTLMKLDHNLFISLNHICFVFNQAELENLCDELEPYSENGIYQEDLPDCILFDEDLHLSALGCLWFNESSVIINMTAIEAAVNSLLEDAPELDKEHEMNAGVWVTLIHELRHLMLNCNPLLPEDELADEPCSEQSVEEYARREFDRLAL